MSILFFILLYFLIGVLIGVMLTIIKSILEVFLPNQVGTFEFLIGYIWQIIFFYCALSLLNENKWISANLLLVAIVINITSLMNRK